MDSYKIRWKISAVKELNKLDKSLIKIIVLQANELAINPFPINSKKLKGTNYTYRIRCRKYRVIYSVLKEILVVEIIYIGHRKDIYKRFHRRKK
jgi:mRNA interferase RelE/StbE